MVIVEKYLKSKTNRDDDCEDSIFISENFASVIDGATSKSSKKYFNKLSGKVSSEVLSGALNNLQRKSSAQHCINYLTEVTLSFYKNLGLVEHLKKNPIDRISSSIIIYSFYRKEIWMVGDCQCLVDNVYYTNKKSIDILLSEIRSFYINTEIKSGKSLKEIQKRDTGRNFILPLLKRQSLFQNSEKLNEFSYGVIDGFKVPRNEIIIKKIPKAQDIVLASDGYPKIFHTLSKSEKYLANIINKDPLLYKEFKSTKGLNKGNTSFDDRAYLSLKKF